MIYFFFIYLFIFLIIAALGRKVGRSIQLNELMKLKECQISRFFSDLGINEVKWVSKT